MKKYARWLIPIIYLGAAIYCLLMVVNPGSAIFYFKRTITSEEIIPYRGNSYRYLIRVIPLVSTSEGVIFYEEGQTLVRSLTANVIKKGNGTYSLGDPSGGTYYLRFSATDNSDPRSNGRRYILYQPVVFLSRNLGQYYLAVLLLGAAGYLGFSPEFSASRKTVRESIKRTLQAIVSLINRGTTRIFSPITRLLPLTQTKDVLWKSLYALTIGAAYFYVFMEWLFFVTKPSFMDLMDWAEKLEILLLTGFAVALIGVVLILICMGVGILLSRTRFATIPVFIAIIIPAFIITVICLLMIDNFTYTIFKFGIVSTVGVWRGAYALGSIVLFYYLYIRVLRVLSPREEAKPFGSAFRISLLFSTGLLVISSFLALAKFGVAYYDNHNEVVNPQEGLAPAGRPNILLIGGDGLNAANLSAYGYERETTPAIADLALNSLMAENAFTNAAHSAGSVISIFTSKPPTRTHVLYPPDILRGRDAYQHLPGILRKIGYRTIEIGIPDYVDAFSMNLLDGFDAVNQNFIEESDVIPSVRGIGYDDSVYFLIRIIERISDRLLHIFFIKAMENPYIIVTQPIRTQTDQGRLDYLEDLIRDTQQPFFIHVHMMGTHGPVFSPEQQAYSKGKTQDAEWITDFYDDSIRNFDKLVGELLYTLKETHQFDHTILIIYSDHGEKYDVRSRIPLLIHFPGNEFSGRIQNNVENLDITPTILDYLGLSQPKWMEGQSLLHGDPPEHRLIFSAGTSIIIQGEKEKTLVDLKRSKPPFYQFSYINVIDCSKWFLLNLSDFKLLSGKVAGHTTPCPKGSILTPDQAKAEILKHLSRSGFDVPDLP